MSFLEKENLEAKELFQNRDRKITVVVPAKDEEKTIEPVLRRVVPYADDFLVVDGHSRDRTVEIAEKSGARVVPDHGLGKGDALRVAIESARGDIIVFIDADGSHEPDDIPRLVAPILKGELDFVIGSRSTGGSDEAWGRLPEFIRNVGGHIIVMAVNYRFKTHLTDCQNGFRAMSLECARALKPTEDITTIEQEMLIKAIKGGWRVGEVPAHEYARQGGESKINLWQVSFRYVWSLIKNLF